LALQYYYRFQKISGLIWGHHIGEKGSPINRNFLLTCCAKPAVPETARLGRCTARREGFLKGQDFQEHLPAGREPEVMDLAIPNGIALSQAMASGLTGNAAASIKSLQGSFIP